MKLEELEKFHETICEEAREVCSYRSDEYAQDEDTLQTFRETGEFCEINPAMVALMQVVLKCARIKKQLLKNEEIKRDHIIDIINYSIYIPKIQEETCKNYNATSVENALLYIHNTDITNSKCANPVK